MPGDVSQESPIHQEVEAIHSGWTLRPTPLEIGVRSLKQVKQRMNHEIAAIKNRFSDLPEARLEAAIGVAYHHTGGLEEDTLVKEADPGIFEKEASARIGHAITHSIVRASSPLARPEFTRAVFDFVKMGQNLRHNKVIQDTTKISNCWVGIQSEVAVVKALLAGGYKVFLPDYSQDSLEVPEEENEVLQLDVRSGVDIIAQKGGKVVLIDAKGRRNLTKVEPIDPPRQIDPNFEWNPCVRKTVADLKARETYRLTLGIPTAAMHFYQADFANPDADPKKTLDNFGKLRPAEESSLIQQMNELEMTRSRPVSYQFA